MPAEQPFVDLISQNRVFLITWRGNQSLEKNCGMTKIAKTQYGDST